MDQVLSDEALRAGTAGGRPSYRLDLLMAAPEHLEKGRQGCKGY
jgi:hypothetical protein